MLAKPQRTVLALLNPVPTYILCSKNINLQVSQLGEKNGRVWFGVPRAMAQRYTCISDKSCVFGGV